MLSLPYNISVFSGREEEVGKEDELVSFKGNCLHISLYEVIK